MSSSAQSSSDKTPVADTQRVVIHCESATIRPRRSKILRVLLLGLMAASLLLNLWCIYGSRGSSQSKISEQHLLGTAGDNQRIAIVNFEGTISPPFTSRWIKQLKQAQEDDSVRGVVLVIDSPGGFVADSHQLYREIQKLAALKPVSVSMKRIAASGGYYIAMGIGTRGRIYVEPTTWTGSIGVIIPRYNATELVQKIGIKSEPLITGSLKDTLNPFRDMTEREQTVWSAIMADAFDRFVSVIADNRSQLNEAGVRELATGQIYTANQAIANHLADTVGYTEDAVKDLAESLKLDTYDAFEFRSTPGLLDVLLGAETSPPKTIADQILQASVPQAMYYASWNPWIP
jgi:protease-4